MDKIINEMLIQAFFTGASTGALEDRTELAQFLVCVSLPVKSGTCRM